MKIIKIKIMLFYQNIVIVLIRIYIHQKVHLNNKKDLKVKVIFKKNNPLIKHIN
jgi:hypothetical protein